MTRKHPYNEEQIPVMLDGFATMLRATAKIESMLLLACCLIACATLMAGRALRANAVEIAFLRGQQDVYALDIERGFIHHLAHTDFPMNVPRWSPDGRNLSFTLVDGSGSNRIGRIDRDGRFTPVFQRAAAIGATAWSPDSQELAFIAGEQVFMMDAEGQHLRPFDAAVDAHTYSLSWSPDGENLAFIGSGARARPYVYVLNLSGQPSGGQAVTDIPANPLARPTWSHDSQQLAFVSGSGLYVAQADGSGLRRVAEPSIPRPSDWSPDGRLAFVSNLRLYVAFQDGGIQSVPTGVRVNQHATWSPDGGWLAFVSGGDLYIIDPDGGQPTLLTPDGDSRAIIDFAWR